MCSRRCCGGGCCSYWVLSARAVYLMAAIGRRRHRVLRCGCLLQTYRRLPSRTAHSFLESLHHGCSVIPRVPLDGALLTVRLCSASDPLLVVRCLDGRKVNPTTDGSAPEGASVSPFAAAACIGAIAANVSANAVRVFHSGGRSRWMWMRGLRNVYGKSCATFWTLLVIRDMDSS